MGIGFELLVIVMLTLVNGFFSAGEISVLSVRRSRLQELIHEGRRSASTVLALRDNPERFLATVQVGITVTGATAGAFGGATLEEPLVAALNTLGVQRAANELALALVVAFVSVLSIVIGELVPKSLALRSSERMSLFVARPIAALSTITRPLIWLLTKLSNLVLYPFRDSTNFTETRLSPEELQTLVEEASSQGTLSPGVGDIASRAIDLGQLAVSALLIPRKDVASISLQATHEQIMATLRSRPHSRYPVTSRDMDSVEGYVLARDLMQQLIDQQSFDIRRVMRELPALLDRTLAVAALRELQSKHAQLALVVDEHGMTAGVITIEDITEELVGEILGEHERPNVSVREEAPGVLLIRAETPVQDVNRRLNIELPLSPDYATISGLLMHASSRIMKPGEQIVVDGAQFEVVEATARQVKVVRLRLGPLPAGEQTPDGP